MIKRGTIENFAKKFQTNDQNITNEYFQHLFLSNFYQNKEARDIVFKGGTALRIIYNSPRFSEDLDFSSRKIRSNEIESLLLNTLNKIEKEGVSVKITEAKTTTGGYLGIIKFKDGKYSSILKLEISFRDKKAVGEAITTSSEFGLPYIIFAINKKDLFEEKIQALLSRSKPRDYYDLYFLIRSNLLTADQKNLVIEAKNKLRNTKIDFSRELNNFLPKSHWPIIKDFRNHLVSELEKY